MAMTAQSLMTTATATALSWAMLLNVSSAAAADIVVLSAPPLRSAMSELLPLFEKSSGHTVTIEYATVDPLVDRVSRGAMADILIVTKQPISSLQHDGKIVSGSDKDIAKVGMGVEVRRGASKPDIGSIDSFKRTMLAARSIAYIDPATAPGGVYIASLFERIGIASDLKGKTKFYGPSGTEAAVAAGEVEIGLSQVTVIAATPGVELVGPLPAEIQNYLQFTAGILVSSKQPDAAKMLIEFLSSSNAASIMKLKGFE
jgi:molybdate transport system substrate-binding protein